MPSQLCLPGIAAPAPATDRLFFALLPEPAAAQEIQRRARDIRQAYGLQSRLIETHRLHLSLQHLGDHAGIPAAWLGAARRAAARVDLPAFDLYLDRVLTFSGRVPEGRQLPCVLTSATDVITPGLHAALGSALRACGIALPARAFNAHVTMFYDRTVIEERAIDPIRFAVRELVIVHSRIGAGKPYELLGSWALSAPTADRPRPYINASGMDERRSPST